jgi:hypothetical protein
MLNLGGAVGDASPNDAEDVMYVKFLLRHFATVSPAMDAAKRNKAMALTVDGAYGPLVRDCIVDYQRLRGESHNAFNPEGRIAPASTTASNWDSSQHSIISLTYAAKNSCGANWPLLSTIGYSSAALNAAVRRALTGS